MAPPSKVAATALARAIVKIAAFWMFSKVGTSGMTEIWFPPYMTNIAPTRTEGEATPMITPAEQATAIMDKLVAKD